MKMKKLKIVLSVFLVLVIIAGGYVGNMFGTFNEGNYGEHSLKNTDVVSDSPINGKTIIFLGSSVTFGYGSFGVSFADFLEKTDDITAIKEAVSGTTIVDVKNNSYISRMKTIDKNIRADAFVCQLSTNDATKEMPLGEISDSFNKNDFDTQTVAGATEYIIAYAKDTWNCPVVFYTQSKYDSGYYAKMVDLLLEIRKKWNITVIDLWNNEEINSITEEQRKIYLVDHIHPTKAGYKEWWLPEFQKCFYKILK
ncbi:MAG: SGNH/GDSL hydrolase family protein [Clostridia bacterium]|nr:SGNH/GDSL hydrolase family protein [Clostridia bacterium]